MTSSTSSNSVFSTALVIDDHPLFCDALGMTLQAVCDVKDVATAPCLRAALERLDQGQAEGWAPDIVVLDLNLPDVQGLDGLVRLKKATVATVVVVSSMTDNRVISSAIHAGAAGFIPKHSQRDVFRQAFDAMARGQAFLPEGSVLLQEEDSGGRDDALSRLASLTNQQARILQLICEGKLNKQIAFDLSIAETTVKAHVTAIMRKLGVHSRTQAVLIAKETSFDEVLRRNG
ncbi:LuxR C-terminal-related transcriptional regulator [Shimia abyssi]|uniref:LuxR family two component transcriptional regulator n=1 Tax=Shimia abyssi TaxID=1662395 RepID=A0A2P8FEK0_9RHOB|nr:response regulator transcription factor [Shimia abyssi]PSL20143.1 LuxR family two component transcriptional regulator [Shimia abyssi]